MRFLSTILVVACLSTSAFAASGTKRTKAQEEEVLRNPLARSAKLRVAERL